MAPSVASLMGTLKSLGKKSRDAQMRGKKGVGMLQREPELGLFLKGSYLFSKDRNLELQ